MNASERKRLAKEAEMQLNALKSINRWKNISLTLSAVGVVLAYNGFAGAGQNLFLGIPGIIIIILGALSAVILNLGLKNGQRNVGKILRVLDDKEVKS